MKHLTILCVFLGLSGSTGCVHRTAMSDPQLASLWKGQPIDAQSLDEASNRWPNEVTLLELQQGFALLRQGDLTEETRAKAKRYFEKATQTFDDLKQPNNFSTAFTADANSPYRGRPYERVLASIFLGILDMADGRCDMAIPSFKAAEFLDARWQPFQYGTDAPLVYALNLRCLKQTRASSADVERAREGLFRSIRMLDGLDDIRNAFERLGKDLQHQDPAVQISFLILDAGISSALMESSKEATAADIFHRIVGDSLRFYGQVVSNKDDAMYDTLEPFAKKLEQSIGSRGNYPSATSLVRLEEALKNLMTRAAADGRLAATINRKIAQSRVTTEAIDKVAGEAKAILVFDGTGPRIKAEGEYKEIATIVPRVQADAKPNVKAVEARVTQRCGVHRKPTGQLTVVLCNEETARRDGIETSTSKLDRWTGVKLWSSSYQATSMVGRRFDKVLKGRAQFRMGSETVALVSAAAAVALLGAGNELARECRLTGRNCEAAQNLQIAGAVAGIFAGGAWLAGRVSNPEADTRHLTDTFESGYLMLNKED